MVEKHISLDLNDDETAKVAEALSNKSCKKILNYLSENEATESELSEELDMPANTVNYNIKKLRESGLVEEKNHFWSDKNKRIPIYGVANKKIVISPKSSFSNKLKSSLPVVLISAIFTAFLLLYERTSLLISNTGNKLMEKAPGVLDTGKEVMAESSNVFEYFGLGVIDWFLIGIWLLVFIFVILNITKND